VRIILCSHATYIGEGFAHVSGHADRSPTPNCTQRNAKTDISSTLHSRAPVSKPISTHSAFLSSLRHPSKAGMKSRSRRLGLETASRLDFDCLGLVSVSGKSGKVSSRSHLEQNFKHLRLVSVSKKKVSFASLYRTEVKLLTAFGKMARMFQ